MEKEMILLDTTVLIEYYRKKNKENSLFYQLTENYSSFAASVVTEYEIMIGCNGEQLTFWDMFFKQITLLSFTREAANIATIIYKDLKKKNQLIAVPDLFIAATALANNLSISTINKNHFGRIPSLTIVDIN